MIHSNTLLRIRPTESSFCLPVKFLLVCTFTALTAQAELVSTERQMNPLSTSICRESLSRLAQVSLTREMEGVLSAHLYYKAARALEKSLKTTNGQFTNSHQPEALKDILDFMLLQNHSRRPFDNHKSVLHLAGASWFSTSPELRLNIKNSSFLRNQEDLFVELFVEELLPKIRNSLQVQALYMELYRIRDGKNKDQHPLNIFLPPPGGIYRLDNFAELFDTIADIETPEQLTRYKESRWLYANMPSLTWKVLDRYVITGEFMNPLVDLHWMDEHPLLGGSSAETPDSLTIAQAGSISVSPKDVPPMLARLRHSYDDFRRAKFGLQQTINRLTGILSSESESLERRRNAHVNFETQLMRVIATMGYGPSRATWTMHDLIDINRAIPGQIESTSDAFRLNQLRRDEVTLMIQLLQSYTKTAALMQLTQKGRTLSQEDLQVLTYEDFVGHDALGRLIGLIANRRLDNQSLVNRN